MSGTVCSIIVHVHHYFLALLQPFLLENETHKLLENIEKAQQI